MDDHLQALNTNKQEAARGLPASIELNACVEVRSQHRRSRRRNDSFTSKSTNSRAIVPKKIAARARLAAARPVVSFQNLCSPDRPGSIRPDRPWRSLTQRQLWSAPTESSSQAAPRAVQSGLAVVRARWAALLELPRIRRAARRRVCRRSQNTRV